MPGTSTANLYTLCSPGPVPLRVVASGTASPVGLPGVRSILTTLVPTV